MAGPSQVLVVRPRRIYTSTVSPQPDPHFPVTEEELARVLAQEEISSNDSKLWVGALFTVAGILGALGVYLSFLQREGVSAPGMGLVILGVFIASAARPAHPKRVLLLEDGKLLVEYSSLVVRTEKEEVVAIVWGARKTVLTRAGKSAISVYGLSLDFCEQLAELFEVPLS